MHCGHARLCVCLSVCLYVATCLHYCTDPHVTWGSGRGCPLVVHYWADLHLVHGVHCYGNTRNAWQSPVVIARPTARCSHCACRRRLPLPAIKRCACCVRDVMCNEAVPFRPHCRGVVMWIRNVSEYMLVLALCLVKEAHLLHLYFHEGIKTPLSLICWRYSSTVVVTFAQSWLDYANSFLLKTSTTNIIKLQRAQNTLAQTVLPNLYSSLVTSLLSHLHWLLLTSHIKHKLTTISLTNHCQMHNQFICTCYLSNTNQFSLFIQVMRLCWLYLQQHLSLADMPSVILHL